MPIPDLQIAGHVARITLRRPDQANRLEPDDLAALADQIAEVNASNEVLVLQLLAEGKYFCSGYNISSIGVARTVAFDAVVNAIEDANPVTMAVLQGSLWVVGGCGGGLMCVNSFADVWIGGVGAASWQQSTAAAYFGGRSGHGMACEALFAVFWVANGS
jgi:1,4-dihydroxy-2-naphthoyl-CoA synthase